VKRIVTTISSPRFPSNLLSAPISCFASIASFNGTDNFLALTETYKHIQGGLHAHPQLLAAGGKLREAPLFEIR